jgi:hypothetical protein
MELPTVKAVQMFFMYVTSSMRTGKAYLDHHRPHPKREEGVS